MGESANLFCVVKIKSLFSSQKNFLLNLETIERSLEKQKNGGGRSKGKGFSRL